VTKAKPIFDAVVGFFETIVFVVTSACIIILAGLVSAEIIMRNFGKSMVIIEELCFIMLGWTAFLSAAYTFRRRGHISIDFFYGKLPPVWRKILYAAVSVSIIIFFAYIMEKGLGIATRQMRIPLTQSRLPRGLIFWGLPVGAGFSIFFMIADLVETFVFGNNASLTTQEEKQEEEIEAGRAEAARMARELLAKGGE
jgi:TRAP-type C4-dicarboxylate transport system permease small subunit